MLKKHSISDSVSRNLEPQKTRIIHGCCWNPHTPNFIHSEKCKKRSNDHESSKNLGAGLKGRKKLEPLKGSGGTLSSRIIACTWVPPGKS
jgi:hypothetical protein